MLKRYMLVIMPLLLIGCNVSLPPMNEPDGPWEIRLYESDDQKALLVGEKKCAVFAPFPEDSELVGPIAGSHKGFRAIGEGIIHCRDGAANRVNKWPPNHYFRTTPIFDWNAFEDSCGESLLTIGCVRYNNELVYIIDSRIKYKTQYSATRS